MAEAAPVAPTRSSARPTRDDTAARHRRPGRPGDRLGRAGDGGLVDQQPLGAEHGRVGGEDVPRPDHQDVAGDDLAGRDRDDLAVAADPGPGGAQAVQGRDAVVGAHLLHGAHHGVADDHEQDDGGVGVVADGDRDRCHRDEHEHERRRVEAQVDVGGHGADGASSGPRHARPGGPGTEGPAAADRRRSPGTFGPGAGAVAARR